MRIVHRNLNVFLSWENIPLVMMVCGRCDNERRLMFITRVKLVWSFVLIFAPLPEVNLTCVCASCSFSAQPLVFVLFIVEPVYSAFVSPVCVPPCPPYLFFSSHFSATCFSFSYLSRAIGSEFCPKFDSRFTVLTPTSVLQCTFGPAILQTLTPCHFYRCEKLFSQSL